MSEEEEHNIKAEDGLAKVLTDLGLNTTFWIPKLRDMLAITNVQALQNFGPEKFEIIKPHCRHSWEITALCKLAEMSGNEVVLKQSQESESIGNEQKQDASTKQHPEQIHQKRLIHSGEANIESETEQQMELKGAKETPLWDGSHSNDMANTSLKQFDLADISNLRGTISHLSLLQNASKGLALEGVYLTGQIKDMLKKRDKLLNIPMSFYLAGPVHQPMIKKQEFSSSEEEKIFETAVEIMGFNTITTEEGFPQTLIKQITSQHNKALHTDEKQEKNPTDTCIHSTKYLYLPLASGNLDFNQLKLSDEALEELQSIEKTLKNVNESFKTRVLSSRLGSFFENFGSHAHTGTVHFGGIFKWKASAEGISSDEEKEERIMLSEAVEMYSTSAYNSSGSAGGVSMMASEFTTEFSEKYNSTLLSKVTFSVGTIGGSPGICSLQQWRTGIVSNTKTWSVIDLGTSLVPVWDIVKFNHKDDFQNTLIASRLKEAYTLLTNQNLNFCLEDIFVSANAKARSVMQDIKHWQESDMENNLEKILHLKQTLYDETKSNFTWINTCLSHPALQSFFSNLVTAPAKTVKITKLMRSIMEPNSCEVDSFPQFASVMQWLNEYEGVPTQLSDFKYLVNILTNAKEDLKVDFSPTYSKILEKRNKEITHAFNSFCQSLRTSKLIEQELLIISVTSAVGYCVKEKRFQHPLNYDNIDHLQRALESAYGEYTRLMQQDKSRAQAYVLRTGLSNARTPAEKRKQLDLMRSQVETIICAKVSHVIKCSEIRPTDWNKIYMMLESIIAGTFKDQTCSSKKECTIQNAGIFSKGEGKEDTYSRQEELQNKPSIQPRKNDEELINLLERLALIKYYPKKLHTSDVCVINRSPIQTNPDPCREQELALSYLQKLIMIDYRARCVSFQCENLNTDNLINLSQSTYTNKSPNSDNFFSDDNDDDVINNSDGPRTNTETHIHPMDLQMAIFHCGDNFVRQYIYTKLSFIQFALPLLVPNPCRSEIEFPIWSFRQIKKSWKYHDASTKKWQSKNCAIIDANTALVSFIRFGESPASKSQMLNSLLGKQKHGVFFHRHCRGSSRNGQLMKGVAEIAWYLPGGKDDDVFKDCIAFTNLHGDAREHKTQVKFLHEMSSINVILLSDGDRNEEGKRMLDECLSSPKPLICLCVDKMRVSSGVSGTNAKIAVQNRNEAEFIDELTSTLNYFLDNSKRKIYIEDFSAIARQYGFIVDEDDKQCKEGKDLAKDLLSLISDKPLCSIKETFLPLQGKLWQSWCKKDKELTRMNVKGGESVEEYKSKISMEKKHIRKAQLEKAFPLNEFMRSLIEILNKKADTVKTYFLHWLRIYLDNLSADRLSQLHLTYHQAWTAIIELKKQGSNASTIAKKQSELDKISEELDASSFGIDHVFREVGQIYEASQTPPSSGELPATLPKIAAEMMISGFPLELMDGDAAHVPLIWISSILDRIIDTIGNVKLFVISILGIQSSGKSTLLNAMFGLQFPVGSGRCTRGAYMQLVKVDAKFSKQLGYDFVLIVDTEGLRSVELSNATRSHDNELATFVIGLGNMTVINIFGENPSEMQDILQIAVQAFLRMRQVKLSPSCVFVHQNVGDVTSHDKNMEGRRRFQEKLDEMTRMAADQEQCTVASFDAVIRFDVNSQIRYFAHLWEGDPPMAPPNPSYCQNIKDLKEMLLRNAKKEKTVNVLKISEFKARIKDLWTALLAENFVFSFKNTIEIAAYTKLEEMYGKWTWELRSYVLQQENKLYNSIDNNTDAMTRSQIERKIASNYQDIKNKMEEHFNSADDAELLVQWKVKFEKGFETVKEELVSDAFKNYSALMAQKDKKRSIDLQRSSYEDHLIRKSKDLASKLRDTNVNEAQWDRAFDKIWKDWIKEIKYGMTSPATLDVEKLIVNLLYDVYGSQSQHLNTVILKNHKGTEFDVNQNEHIMMNVKWLGTWSHRFKDEDTESLKKLISDIKFNVKSCILTQEKHKTNYKPSYIYEILKVINTDVERFSKSNQRFKLKDKFKIDLSVHILAEVTGRFQEMHENFQRENDPLVYFSRKKDEYFNSFKIRCQGSTSTTIFVDFLCNKLKTSIQQAVYDKVCIDIAGRMKSTFPAFNGNRSKLENYILIDLAKMKDFKAFDKYIHHPKEHFQKYITECVEEYCNENDNEIIHEMLKSSLGDSTAAITRAINKATEIVQDNEYDASSWLDTFCTQLDDVIKLPRHTLDQSDCSEITDIEFLKEQLTDGLKTVALRLNEQFSYACLNDLEDVQNKPHEILFRQLCGCWVQCPFCKAICTNTMSNHDGDHSVSIHRPQAVSGTHWHETDNFVTDICTSLVASNCSLVLPDREIPYKDYRTAGPEYVCWSITPDLTTQPYWKWFVCKFKSDLEKRYNLKFSALGKVPSDWDSIKEDDIIKDLENL
ncbi:interferon-induced very large GTPase 1-like [Lethenteron reissneri]|uniref:interferon-induced very large GTPase 1-like n=1 Tax=Lethenteron reissneri TaxID=7753 RepID=UPI002AB614C3|nr:interferon-induced very large GTPase 1-like [Lethenteron reissneri]XP_061403898.1 interferon-induced very large GTPase 1-like [Lethenteron reissneri]XP_061403899.1 interferon-induced very large GTPase 1-like [Lethenteron reissneri]